MVLTAFFLSLALSRSSDVPAAPNAVKQDAAKELTTALRRLQNHLQEGASATPADIRGATATIVSNSKAIARDAALLKLALDTSAAYETKQGPLFINAGTRNGFQRKGEGLELDRAAFALQQAIIDHAYTPSNLMKYRSLLEGTSFKTSEYFPGPVKESPNPNQTHQVKINATLPEPWGRPVMNDEDPARRPTGCYLAPGSFATVTVPKELVGKGFSIRVGAHSWDLEKKPVVKRLDRVSLVYPIATTTTTVGSPLGGGIYIEVPPKSNSGQVDIAIKNVVRSPFFSARKSDRTSLDEWRNVQRKHPGPWADFESGKFMMQVPTKWIYAYDDPVSLIRDWDKAMDMVSDLFAYPRERARTVLYLQVDVVLRGSAFFPGYPQSNFLYNPHSPESGRSNHWLLRGPQTEGATIFHELGHAQLFTKFPGETEAAVNLPYVAVLNQGFGVDLDTAFGRSFDRPSISLDQAANMWMVTQNFRDGKPMDISNTERNEVRYQHRGYAKYVEVAKLFGWSTLQKFWKSYQDDYMKGKRLANQNADPIDPRILRMSKSAGVDLTPLIHFWGVHPVNPATLKAEIQRSGLRHSAAIYDRLKHYMSLIPMSNQDFRRHVAILYPNGLRPGQNPMYGEGWYEIWMRDYNESHGVAAKASLQSIIDAYFPEGRPAK